MAKHYITKDYDMMLIRCVSGDHRDGRLTQTLARNNSSAPVSKRIELFHSSHPRPSPKPFFAEKFRQASAHSLSGMIENSRNYTQATGTDSGPKETTKEDSKVTQSLAESAAINAEAIWNELEKRMKSRKREEITSEERQKLSIVFSSFERRGWAADQALALYMNSKLFPMAASRFRDLFMQATTKDLKNEVLSLADNIPAVEAFLFPLFSVFCFNNFPVEIKTYRDLVNSSNMTKPHTRFPFSRAMKRKIVYHQGPTKSGKTHSALRRFREAKSGIYCSPLRLSAMEVYDSVNLDGVNCNLVTGQEKKEIPSAQHTSCIIEMANLIPNYEVAVLDEFQMITDEHRGWAWARAFLELRAEEIHVCGEKSALSLISNIVDCTGDEFVDFEYEQFKPLTIDLNSVNIKMASIKRKVSVIEKRRESWKLSDDDANFAIALMKADGLTEEEMEDDLRAFLYAKGIMSEKDKRERILAFNNLLNPDGAMGSDQARKNLKLARERLRTIVVKGEVGKNFDEQASLFDDFVAEHPEWGPNKSFVVFRDHELLKDKPHAYVERVQLSGLCYMHAPIILQHYLVAMFSVCRVPMLDMADYLKKHISGKLLKRRIWDDEGGDSQTFLESILVQASQNDFLTRRGEEELEPFLKLYGPALISRFKVEEAFYSVDWQHLGAMTNAPKGSHAMVLVGIRKEDNVTRYLLQNWWKEKVFVEIDGKYLNNCRGLVTFVKTPQLAMGSFPTNPHDHVECELLDAPETFNLEMSF